MGKQRLTVHRETIPWYPEVDIKLCSSCGICRDFCPRGVYDMSPGPARVIEPYRCVVLCSRCSSKCPSGAIGFPDRKDFVQYVVPEKNIQEKTD